MNVSGLTPIRLIEKPGGTEVQLRTNQRVSAEILNVSGDQVDLMIRGVRVVGKLVAKDQSAELAGRQTAQFIVKGMVNGELQLQLLNELQPAQVSPQEGQWITLSKNLLHLLNLPDDTDNVLIAKALLKNNLPVTRQLMAELQQSLQAIGPWGEGEAEMAAALKAGGFPISNGILELALQKLPDFNGNIQQLQSGLQQILQKETSPEVRQMLQSAMQLLQDLQIDLSASPEKMSAQIKNVISFFGKSIESNLAALLDGQAGQAANFTEDGKLNLLLQLRTYLSNRNENANVKLIDTLISSMRQMQLLNTAQITDPMDPPWLIVNLPVNAGALLQSNPQGKNEFSPANIKIAYQSGNKDKKIDPQDTRLILSFDLDSQNKIKIDVSMLGKKLGAWMTVSSEDWKQRVEAEAPSFEKAMEALGYAVQFTKCNVSRDVSMTDRVDEMDSTIPAERVDVQV